MISGISKSRKKKGNKLEKLNYKNKHRNNITTAINTTNANETTLKIKKSCCCHHINNNNNNSNNITNYSNKKKTIIVSL